MVLDLGLYEQLCKSPGSRVATLVVWGGEWEVQEGLGRASKPSPTLLAPAERVSPKLRIIVYSFQCFINILSLMLRKRFMLILSKLRMQKQQPCQTECGGIANRAGVCYDGSNRSLPVRATEEGDKILC